MSERLQEVLLAKEVALDYARKLGVGDDELPWFGYNNECLCVRVNKDGYWYGFIERGHPNQIVQTENIENLMYYIFRDVTSSLASDFELRNRKRDEDHRHILFSKHEEFLGVLSSEWADRLRQYHKDILTRHPFDDQNALSVSDLLDKSKD